jgi:hypothetical protein
MRNKIAYKISAYLEGRINLQEIVSWAETLLVEGFDATPVESEIIFRLGCGDTRNFELSWEDLSNMLYKLGYTVRLELKAA